MMTTNSGDPRRGAALLSALVLSLVLAGLLVLFLSRIYAAGTETARARDTLLAEARLETALFETLRSLAAEAASEIRYDEAFASPADPGVEIVIVSHDGRIDLNAASPFLLASVFEAAGRSPEEAAALGDAIADWRDSDDLTRLNGAEARDYARAGRAGPANRPFERLEEVAGVLGMDADLAACLVSISTVSTGRMTPDLSLVPAWLADALGIVQTTRPRVSLTAGTLYEIHLRETDRPSPRRLVALVRPTGDIRRPLLIHDWRIEADTAVSPACPEIAEEQSGSGVT